MLPGLIDKLEKDKTSTIVVEEPVEKSEEDESLGIDTAVDDLMSALKTDDKAAFKSALKAFIYFCEE